MFSAVTILEEDRMEPRDLSGTTAIVTGASRGFGRGITIALAATGATVVGVARDQVRLAELRVQLGEAFIPVVADVTDPVVAGWLIDQHRPRTVVLNAGATPQALPLQEHTWQSFSTTWDVDVQQVFHWTRKALLSPMPAGSVVIAFGSGAALTGSPLTGGYAGAKATIAFIASYAAAESERSALGIRFTTVLPALTPATSLGATAVRAYAERQGVDPDSFVTALGPRLTPEQVGKATVDLATDPHHRAGSYHLSVNGLAPVD
jgi:NADP-dependent 3-hydroxy acid dehydrogenase YdfG